MFVHADIGTQCYVDGWGGVGWDDNVHVTRDAQRTAMQNLKLVDNSTESEISRVKGQMRRTNMLGRISPRNAQVQQFCCQASLREAWVDASGDGFCGISQRSKKPNGYSTRSRRHAFQIEKDNAWLP